MARVSLRRISQALLASVLVSASTPAFAARYFNYTIQGNFLTSTGPGKPSNAFPGTYQGSMVWDTQANDLGGGNYAGGWSEWNIKVNAQTPGTYLYTFASGDGAGCFSSPLTNLGNGSSGPYSVGTAGDCKGGGTSTSTVPFAQTTTGVPDFINFYDPGDYTWGSGPTGGGLDNWFRVPVTAVSTTNFLNASSADYGKLTFDATKNNVPNGWYSFNAGPTASSPTTCNGATQAVNPSSSAAICPWASSSSYQSGLGGTVIITYTGTSDTPTLPPEPASIPGSAEVPAPLPALGMSMALVFSRKLRKRIREQAI